MTAIYNTTKEFNEAIYEFVEMGLTFQADHQALTIHFKGGY